MVHIRARLSEALNPHHATLVLVHALDRMQDGVPETDDEVQRLLDGPLPVALEKRVGRIRARATVQDIRERLARMNGELAPESSAQSQRQTLETPRSDGPATVLVFSESGRVAEILDSSGVDLARAITVSTTRAMRLMAEVRGATMLVLDAHALPRVERESVVEAARALHRGVLVVVWGVELPAGTSWVSRLVGVGVPALGIDSSGGLDALVDLIASRQTGRS